MLNIGGWSSVPGEETSGVLGTVLIGLHAALYPTCQSFVRSPLVLLVISVPYLHHSLYYYPSTSPTTSTSPYNSSPPPPPPSTHTFAAACPVLIPRISRAGSYHHCLDMSIPGFCSATRHKSMIGRVTIYCATLFWQREIYTPISSSPTVASAAPMGVYTHVPHP